MIASGGLDESDDSPDAGLDGPLDGTPESRAKIKKAPNAFRTISEVADELHIPQHVLRFWETKFPQVKPLKRGGGRRYYRPDDIALLRRISGLLYIQGYTIKGVQRLLREGGGRLSDDIPPPAPEEKAGPDHVDPPEPDEPQLPMPGLVHADPVTPARTMRPKPDQVKPSPTRTTDSIDTGEVARLRGVLRETLRELEALRALLR
jgi:DNA-binding transcriptional MerR regulator